MKHYLTMTLTALLMAAFFTFGEGASGLRSWSSTKGASVNASFEKLERGMVYLKKEDGKTIKINMNQLVQSDQQAVRDAATAAAKGKLNGAPTASAISIKAPEAIYDLFGEKLKNAKKKSVSTDELDGKIIGVYFSAHWCGPCRRFTPELVKFYNELQEDEKPFEIVFVSSDRDKSAMYSYMKENDMPWLALPFEKEKKAELSSKYQVRGIPTLVILNSKGELITKNGRGDVSRGTAAFDAWEKKN